MHMHFAYKYVVKERHVDHVMRTYFPQRKRIKKPDILFYKCLYEKTHEKKFTFFFFYFRLFVCQSFIVWQTATSFMYSKPWNDYFWTKAAPTEIFFAKYHRILGGGGWVVVLSAHLPVEHVSSGKNVKVELPKK